jgi:formamidopyrimidine-DNA glycosylase
MPELAEVEHARRTWDVGLGKRVFAVEVSSNAGRVVRDVDLASLRQAIEGQPLRFSEARGKQLCFRFGKTAWLAIHLGMAGALSAESAGYVPAKHDLLVLRQKGQSLVFTDLRHFGRVRLHLGSAPPSFWTALPPSLSSGEFTPFAMRAFCDRRARSALKTVLLDQRRFPGIGNWMADEILWRARLAPDRLAGSLDEASAARLYRAIRWVSAAALRVVDASWEYPRTWLFRHRWEDGGHCPRCGSGLQRVVLGGRRTCFCPTCQRRARLTG